MTTTPSLTPSTAHESLVSPDGVSVSLLQVTPASPRGIALLLPAMGVGAGYYAKAAEYLAQRGIAAAVLELRGQGDSEVRPAPGVDFGYAQLLDDLAVTLQTLRRKHPGIPVVLLGHSLGGHLSMLQIATKPRSVDAVVLIATATPHHGPYEGAARWKVGLGTRMVRFVSSVLGYYPGHRLGFGGLQPKTLMREWTRMARSASYALDGSMLAIEAALQEVSIPVLALAIVGDEVAPRAACKAIVAKLPKAQVDWVELGAPQLSPRACHHQRWAREPAAVMEEVLTFIQRRVLKSSEARDPLGSDVGATDEPPMAAPHELTKRVNLEVL
jgi:predicted alpha/beta hydrolase